LWIRSSFDDKGVGIGEEHLRVVSEVLPVEVVELESVEGDHEVGEYVEEHPVAGDGVEAERKVVKHHLVDDLLRTCFRLFSRNSDWN
jgi:hypothetical protein